METKQIENMENTKTQTTETKEVLGDLIERKLHNRIKYNFFKTLYSGGFDINTTSMKDRIKKDFEKQNIIVSEEVIDVRVRDVLYNKRYELWEWIF